MKRKFYQLAACLTALSAVIIALAVIFAPRQARIDYTAEYYLVYYKIETDAHSASSVSSTVSGYGGAGYVLCYNGRYYITVACYYRENEARSVCSNLRTYGLDCEVLAAKVDGYKLNGREASVNANKYLGNLNTLDSLSRLCYEAANAADGGNCGQDALKSIVTDIKNSLCALVSQNTDNCFTEELDYLLTLCGDILYGTIYPKELRSLQIAVADCILNIKLY